MTEMLAPPLTTIWQPAEDLGETAVFMLVRHVRDKAPLVRDTWACASGFGARLVGPSRPVEKFTLAGAPERFIPPRNPLSGSAGSPA